MLARRYGSFEFFEKLESRDALDFLVQAINEKTKEEIYMQWVALLPHMYNGELKFMAFNEYYDRVSGRNIDMRSDEELLQEIENARRELDGNI